MSQTNIAITQLAQVGLAERIAQENQGHPEVSRQAAQQTAPQELKNQKDTVAQSEHSEETRGVKAEKDGRKGGGRREDKKRDTRSASPEEPQSVANTPWAGNILNLKV